MRTSAISRTAHAAAHAALAANSNKAADPTFAAMLASVSPQAGDKAAKTAQKDMQGEQDAPPDDQASQATPQIAAQDRAGPDAQVKSAAKPAKDDETGPVAAIPVAADAAPQPDAILPQPQIVAMQTPAPTAVPQTDTAGGTDALASVPATQQAAAPAANAPQDTDTESGDDVKPDAATAAAQPVAPRKPANDDTKPDTGVKTRKVQAPVKTASNDVAPTGKSDTGTSDIGKAAVAPAIDAPAKPAPQPANAPAPDTNVTIAAPQAPAATAASAPTVAQHVQVTPQEAAPNLPALAVQIAVKSQSGARQFDIRLDPPELGRVDVRLSIDATGKTSAHLTADQPQTLDLLQKDSTSLTQALRDAGLNVSQDGLNFSLRQQNHEAGQQSGHAPNFSRGGLIATTTSDATPTSAATRAPANGRLDIRV